MCAAGTHWTLTNNLHVEDWLANWNFNFNLAYYKPNFCLPFCCLVSGGIKLLFSMLSHGLTMTYCDDLLVFVRPQASANCVKAIDLLTLPADVRIWLYLNKRTEADITCTFNRSVGSGQSRLSKDKSGFHWYFLTDSRLISILALRVCALIFLQIFLHCIYLLTWNNNQPQASGKTKNTLSACNTVWKCN